MSVSQVKATINGQVYVLAYNASTKAYEATISAPTESSFNQLNNKYGVMVEALDEAGNKATADRTSPTLGESLQLRVLEKIAPVISITYPTQGAMITTNSPRIEWSVTDLGSGVNDNRISLSINGAPVSGIAKTPITNGFSCTVSPSAIQDGNVNLSFSAEDNDGNTTSSSVQFVIDTVAPTLTVTSPAVGLITNASAQNVTGITTDATSGIATVKVSVNGADQGAITVAENGAFSKAISLIEGSNTIIVTATDTAGKFTSIQREVVLDTVIPVFVSVSLVPNPVDSGKTLNIKVVVTD